MVSGTHTTPIRIPKDMGMVWEAYHKGVPLWGVPGITLDPGSLRCNTANMPNLLQKEASSSSKHHFSGVNSLLILSRVIFFYQLLQSDLLIPQIEDHFSP